MDKKQLEVLVAQDNTIRQIASEVGCSMTNVRYWLRKFSLKTRRGPHGTLFRLPPQARLCGKCGETDTKKFYGHKRSICGKCQNQYNTERGREKKAYMRKTLGGKCIVCGFDKYQCSLDIHHLNPAEKDISFATSRGWTYERIDEEMKKCILLCKNCHSALHCNEINLIGV